MNLYTVVNTIAFHNTYPLDSDLSGPSCSKGGQYYPPDKPLSSGWCTLKTKKDLFQPQSVNSGLQAEVRFSPSWSI